MKKVVRLTESDLVRIVKRVISEQTNGNDSKTLESMLVKNGFKKTINQGVDIYTYGNNGVTLYYDTKNSQCIAEMSMNQSYTKQFKFPINVNDVVNYVVKLKHLYDANKNVVKGVNRGTTSR